jgi:hypothetical protein
MGENVTCQTKRGGLRSALQQHKLMSDLDKLTGGSEF